VKERTVAGFGKRLREIRQRRGLTQAELGVAVGVSKRVITYYERDDALPPGAVLVHLAQVLRVSTDELLGVCHCGAEQLADDPIELWTWLLAHPDGHEPIAAGQPEPVAAEAGR